MGVLDRGATLQEILRLGWPIAGFSIGTEQKARRDQAIMNTFLITLLLAAGVSCAPPFLPDPVTTTTKPIQETTVLALTETTTTLPTEDLPTTVTPAEEITTTQKQDAITTTVAPTEVTTVEQKEEISEEVITVITEQPVTTTVAKEIITTTTTAAPTTPEPTKAPRLSGKERESRISHLGNVDLTNVDKLVLTPTQRLAIAQELEYQELGLAPFTDPTPWQRLTREQQTEFSEKYLALRSDLQEYSRNQFLSLPEDGQAHAYGAFLSLDLETLSEVIEGELQKEREILEAQRVAEERERQRNTIQEQPRSQQGNRFNSFNFNQIDQRNQQ